VRRKVKTKRIQEVKEGNKEKTNGVNIDEAFSPVMRENRKKVEKKKETTGENEWKNEQLMEEN